MRVGNLPSSSNNHRQIIQGLFTELKPYCHELVVHYANPNLHQEIAHTKNCQADSVFGLGSLTKSFSAILTEKLSSLGLIPQLDKPIKLPNGICSLAQMLTHTAGLPEYRTDTEKSYYGQRSDLDELASANLTDKQGSYEYSNTGYFHLEKIIEDQAGQKFSDLMYKYITEPHGLTSVGFVDKHENNPKLVCITHTPDKGEPKNYTSFDPSIKYALPDGGLFSNVFDLHRLYAAITKDPNFMEAHNRIKVPMGNGSFYGLGMVEDGTRYAHSGAIPMFYTSYASYDCKSGSFLGVLSTLKNTETNQSELIQKIENAQANLA